MLKSQELATMAKINKALSAYCLESQVSMLSFLLEQRERQQQDSQMKKPASSSQPARAILGILSGGKKTG